MQYCVRSRSTKDANGQGVPLRDPDTDELLFEYDRYVKLLAHKPWRVPVLFGRMPPKPQALGHRWHMRANSHRILEV